MDTRAAYAGGNPTVVRVTSLLDDGSSGTLRWALTTQGNNIVVVFETSGTINLSGILVVLNSSITVAGQTAPSPGITLRNFGMEIRGQDVLFQHFRIRPGAQTCNGSLQVYGGAQHNIVLDHMSFSWGQDENLAFNWTNGQSTDATVWRCIMAEGIFQAAGGASCEGGGTSQGHGILIDAEAGYVAVIQSLFSTNVERNPYMLGKTNTALVNNLQYQTYGPWGFFYNNGSACGLPCTNYPWYSTVMGNRFIKGPNSTDGGNPTCNMFTFSQKGAGTDSPPVAGNKIYRNDNTIANPDGTTVYEVNLYPYDPSVGSIPAEAPLPTGLAIMPSTAVEAFVLANAGARPADRDAVDLRVIANVTARSGNFVHDQNTDTPGYPNLAVVSRAFVTPPSPHTVQLSGYTTLEETLHAMAAAVEGTVPVTSVPDAAGATDAQDTFTGVANTVITSHALEIGGTWSAQTGSSAGWQLSNVNRLLINTPDVTVVTLSSATPFSSEYDVFVDLIKLTLPANNGYLLWGRASLGDVTGYFVGYDVASSTLALYLVVSSVYTLLGNVSYVPGASDRLQLLLRNTSKSVKVNGVSLIYSTDNTITSAGLAGIGGLATGVPDTNSTGIHYDNFKVVDVLSGGANLSGVQALGSTGAVKQSTATSLTGFGSTAGQGVVNGGAKTVALSGVTATLFQGVFGHITVPTPVSGAVSIGVLGLTRTKALAGLATAASIGAISIFQTGTASLTGVSATSAAGITVPGLTKALTGPMAATGAAGSVATGVNQAALTGVQATSAQGFVSLPGAVTLALTSVGAIAVIDYVQPPAAISGTDPDTGNPILQIPNYLTIAGTSQQILAGWSVTDVANNTGSMRFAVTSDDGSYVPQLDDEVIYFENGVKVFGGYISSTLIGGLGGEGGVPTVVNITALDYNALATRRFYQNDIPIATLKQTLQLTVAYVPGVKLDTMQVDGPVLEKVDYTGWKIFDIWNNLTTLTGYIWQVDYNKTLRMFAPGSVAAPFDITTANRLAILDITSEPVRKNFANRVIVYGQNNKVAFAQDLPSILKNGYWEVVAKSPDNNNQDSLNTLAATILAVSLPVLRTVKYTTLKNGLGSGMTQTITIPGRSINNTFLLSEVTTTYIKDFLTKHTVTATEGLVYQDSWRSTLRAWGGATGGAGGITIGGGGGPVGTSTGSRYANNIGGNGVDANSSPSSGVWVPVAGGSASIGDSAVQVQMNTVPRLGTDAQITARVKVLESGNSVTLRLFDVTVGQACTGISAAVTSQTWQTVTWGVTLVPGSHYVELEMLTSVVGSPVLVTAYIE